MFNRIFRNQQIENISKGFDVTIDSDMSIGAGVGSSASFGVCLASGFYILSQIISEKLTDQNFSFAGNDAILSIISQWAFDSEVLMHEKPSGIDNTICTYGQLIKFERGQTPEPIKTSGKVDILLVDTKVSRSTSHVVGKVVNLKNKYGDLLNSIFDAMGYLVDDVVNILESEKTETEKFQELSLLVSINNNLLRSIGVSHPRLEKIFNIAESHGFNAKLTGAGAGGCAFVLLPSNYEGTENYRKMCEDLTRNDYQIMATIIGGSGVDLKFSE
jgi:mevalonate kinase